MRFLTIGKGLALLGAVLLVAGPLGTRLGLWSFVVGFACFAMSGLCGLLALVFSLVGGSRTNQWKRAERAQQAVERVLDEVREFGWDISAAEPAEGRIEAVDTTLFFGFKDDVVIRLRPVEGGTRVDVRSTSRVGLGDAGTNAKRIRRLLAALRARG